MVIDATGDELDELEPRDDGKRHGGDCARRARQQPAQPAGGKNEQCLHGEREGQPGQAVGALRIGEQAEQADQRRQRQIDHARPVHERAGGGIKAQRAQVIPALAGKPVAHLHHAHGIVGVDIEPVGPDLHHERPAQGEGRDAADGDDEGEGRVLRHVAARHLRRG